jgi:hypothetical protein
MIAEAVALMSTTPIHSGKYQEGADAKFLRINDKWGLKFFQREDQRNDSYVLQEQAAELGLAPQIGDKFEFTFGDDDTRYGFITECIVETCNDRFRPEINWNDYSTTPWQRMYAMQEYQDLINGLRNNGFAANDMHEANVGWLPDGRLVAIDFSREAY